MGEIKFKGKDKYGNWVKGYYVKRLDEEGREKHYIAENYADTNKISPGMKLRYYPVDPETVGQYTGREDKNSKEIYEGDIVEFNNYENGEMYKGLVIFYDCSFCINLFDDYDYRYMREFHYIKILGNKYENPELLKEAKDELEN